jgi:hypothetical protein
MTMYRKLFSPRCLLALLLEDSWVSRLHPTARTAPTATSTATQNYVLSSKLRPARGG